MNFLKNNKKLIAGIAIGVLTTTGIGYAANNYFAGDIRYTKSGASSSISVADALNELYTMKENKYTQEQYDNNYNRGLNDGKSNNTGYLKTGVTLKHDNVSELSYYELGFEPSFVCIVYTNGWYSIGFKGNQNLYWRNYDGLADTYQNAFNTDSKGFYYSINGSGTWTNCTIYAVK